MTIVTLEYLSRALGPSETRDGALIAWTPKSGACWALQTDAGCAALYRLDGKSVEVAGSGRKALGLEGVEQFLELFAGADGVLRLYGAEEGKPTSVWRWGNGRFEHERVTGIETSDADAYCGVPETGRFLHVQGASGTVYELTKGALKNVGTLGAKAIGDGLSSCIAVWDGSRDALVIAGSTTEGLRTVIWKDGKATTIEGVPHARSTDRSLKWSIRLVTDPDPVAR